MLTDFLRQIIIVIKIIFSDIQRATLRIRTKRGSELCAETYGKVGMEWSTWNGMEVQELWMRLQGSR